MAKLICTSELRPLTLMQSNKDGVVKQKGYKQFSYANLHIYHSGLNLFIFGCNQASGVSIIN